MLSCSHLHIYRSSPHMIKHLFLHKFLSRLVLNLSPGSTLTLPRSVGRNSKRHSLGNPPTTTTVNSIQSDYAQKPPFPPSQNERPGTPPSSYSTPRKQPLPRAPGNPAEATGYSPYSDNSVDNDIYYEALEYPLIEASDKGCLSNQGFTNIASSALSHREIVRFASELTIES